MHANWNAIQEKWPRYGFGERDADIVDVSQCVFFGQGMHELAVCSFRRYLQHTKVRVGACYPICLQFGIHFPERVALHEPAIGHLRTTFFQDTAGMLEPAYLLAVLASKNGRAFWERLQGQLATMPTLDSPSPHSHWLMSTIEDVLLAAQCISDADLPDFVEEPPSNSCEVVISIDDVPQEQFSGYDPSDEELSPHRRENWIYLLKKKIKKGTEGRTPHPERVVLKEDLRRVHESLYKGQLGWTVPNPGFVRKKGSDSLWIEVAFDSNVQELIDVYWIDFIRDECSRSVSEKIISSFRDSPFDANAAVAAKWHRKLPFYNPSEVTIVGRGFDEIYAYTYLSSVGPIALDECEFYPMKIGYTSSIGGALDRINGQFPRAIANDVRVLFIGRCDDGRGTESRIHQHMKKNGRRIESAPGNEWFKTNVREVEELFFECR